MTPDKLPDWEGAGTDEMRFQRRHMEFTSEGHRPELAGTLVDVSRQGQAVANGFAQVYRILQDHRDELLATDGLLNQFAAVEVRVIVRATRTYSLLLQESNHPDLLQDGLDRDRLYAQLWRDVLAAPRLAQLVPAELRDLHNGDVPIFHARPGERHLWDSTGRCISDYLSQSGLDRVRTRLLAMNDQDMARQIWYVQASFATLNAGDSHAGVVAGARSAAQAEIRETSAAFLGAAHAIGDRLEQIAHRHGDHAVWIGLGLDSNQSWSLSPLTMQLYDGHAGLALFLAYLAEATGEQRYNDLAAAALATVRVQIDQQRATFPYAGAFSGWGGVIYLLAHLGTVWGAT